MNYYFHLPFCRKKCAYCAFYSIPDPEPEMVELCLNRFERILSDRRRLPASTVYIGGGTPTLLSAAQLERLFRMIQVALTPLPDAEISIESNPETLDEEKVALLRNHVTRLSLGVQSFDEKIRNRIGRNCSGNALNKALTLVRDARFPHWNIDLIYAVPGQNDGDVRNDLNRAIDCGCDHLSCYALTPEEGSALGGGFPVDDEAGERFWKIIGRFLAVRGMNRYEISNYARPGAECRHNRSVWRGGKLTGFGPSASGFDGVDRTTERHSLTEWLAGKTPETDHIPPGERRDEIFAVNLRTVEGWTPELWRQVPGADSWEARQRVVEQAASKLNQTFFLRSPERIALSDEGMLFWNSVAEELIFH